MALKMIEIDRETYDRLYNFAKSNNLTGTPDKSINFLLDFFEETVQDLSLKSKEEIKEKIIKFATELHENGPNSCTACRMTLAMGVLGWVLSGDE